MNANELADDLDNANGFQYIAQLGLASKAATMLRQQHLRIEQLLETQQYLYKVHDADKAQLKAAEQMVIDAVDRGKSLGYAEGLKKVKEK